MRSCRKNLTRAVWRGRRQGRAHKTLLVTCGAPAKGAQSCSPQKSGRELWQQLFGEIQDAEVSALHSKCELHLGLERSSA